MGEPAGEDDAIGAAEVGLLVKDQLGVGSERAQRMDDVVFAVGTGEDDDGDGHPIRSTV